MKNKEEGYKVLQQMNNWGYYHYFFARILYYLSGEPQDFQELVRSKKQSSFILQRIFEEKDFVYESNNSNYNPLFDSVANFCLIRRYHIDEYHSKRNSGTKLKLLIKCGYLPEMKDIDSEISAVHFIEERDNILNSYYSTIWSL